MASFAETASYAGSRDSFGVYERSTPPCRLDYRKYVFSNTIIVDRDRSNMPAFSSIPIAVQRPNKHDFGGLSREPVV